MKRKFIVLDVEGMNGVAPYNVGYIIADRHGKIYQERSFALPQYIMASVDKSNQIGQAIEMTARNATEILADFALPEKYRKYKAVSAEVFKRFFLADLKKHKISKIYAYNASFDKGRISDLFGEDFQKIGAEWVDIIPLILRTKLLTRKYCQFCIDNGFITEKGNIQTKAETVYRYLTGNTIFEEEHTGLADCKIEYQILLAAIKTKRKLDSSPCQAWRELKQICLTNNLQVKIGMA